MHNCVCVCLCLRVCMCVSPCMWLCVTVFVFRRQQSARRSEVLVGSMSKPKKPKHAWPFSIRSDPVKFNERKAVDWYRSVVIIDVKELFRRRSEYEQYEWSTGRFRLSAVSWLSHQGLHVKKLQADLIRGTGERFSLCWRISGLSWSTIIVRNASSILVLVGKDIDLSARRSCWSTVGYWLLGLVSHDCGCECVKARVACRCRLLFRLSFESESWRKWSFFVR